MTRSTTARPFHVSLAPTGIASRAARLSPLVARVRDSHRAAVREFGAYPATRGVATVLPPRH